MTTPDLVIDSGDYPTLQAAHDAAFGSPANPHGTANVNKNIELRIRGGNYLPPFSGAPVLDTRYLHGGRIVGSGRFVTKLIQNVAGVPVVRTNGCGYSHFEGFLTESQSIGTGFDLSWDGTAGGAALQSNTFNDLLFLNGTYGVKIGEGGFMGSENTFNNCYWQSNSVAGLATLNGNALQQQLYGGNFQHCGIGVWAALGSVPIISGVGFQQSQVCDIRTENNPANNILVAGCRTESPFFIDNAGGHGLEVSACSQIPAVPATVFVRQVGGLCRITSSRGAGQIVPTYWNLMTIQNCGFDREDWLEPYQPWFIPNNGIATCIEVENVWAGAAQIIRKRRYESTNGVNFNKQSDYAMVLVL